MRAKHEERNSKVRKERQTLMNAGVEARKEVATAEAVQQLCYRVRIRVRVWEDCC
jgi:hypothetical protein